MEDVEIPKEKTTRSFLTDNYGSCAEHLCNGMICPNAGFYESIDGPSLGLPIGSHYREKEMSKRAQKIPQSMLLLYIQLLALRKKKLNFLNVPRYR